jgi:hypothetical protein
MDAVALTGKDTTVLDSTVYNDFADGDCIVIDFANDIVEIKKGKNGNAIYSPNAQGELATATLRLIAGSTDDKRLNSRLAEFRNDSPAFVFIAGEFTKRVGDGQGNVTNITYSLEGGVIKKIPSTKENIEGDTEQAVSIWVIAFARGKRLVA